MPVRLICLPEGQINGYVLSEEVIKKGEVYTIPGEETDLLGEFCKKYDSYLVASMACVRPELIEGRSFNTAFILDPRGKIVYKHSKGSFYYPETGSTAPSDIWSRLLELSNGDAKKMLDLMYPVAKTKIGNIGCLVGGESTWFEPSRAFALNGAEILWRTSYEDPYLFNEMWEVQNRAFAVFNSCYVIAPNTAGLDHGRSEIIDYQGRILSLINYTREGFAAAIFNIDGLRDYRVRGLYVASAIKAIRTEQYMYIYKAFEDQGGLFPRNLHMDQYALSREQNKLLHCWLINRAVELGIYTPPLGWKPYKIRKDLLDILEETRKKYG